MCARRSAVPLALAASRRSWNISRNGCSMHPHEVTCPRVRHQRRHVVAVRPHGQGNWAGCGGGLLRFVHSVFSSIAVPVVIVRFAAPPSRAPAGVEFEEAAPMPNVRLRQTACRLPLVAAAASLAGAVFVASPADAQQFLGFGRGTCDGVVTIASARMSVRHLELRSGPIESNRVTWRCNNGPEQAFTCPASTNFVQVDRRQGSSNFSIVCMRR